MYIRNFIFIWFLYILYSFDEHKYFDIYFLYICELDKYDGEIFYSIVHRGLIVRLQVTKNKNN